MKRERYHRSLFFTVYALHENNQKQLEQAGIKTKNISIMHEKIEISTLMTKIMSVTMEIKMHYPESYKNLTESPLFSNKQHSGLNEKDFEDYLNTIQSLLKKMTNF